MQHKSQIPDTNTQRTIISMAAVAVCRTVCGGCTHAASRPHARTKRGYATRSGKSEEKNHVSPTSVQDLYFSSEPSVSDLSAIDGGEEKDSRPEASCVAVLFVRHSEAAHNVADAVARKTASQHGTCTKAARLSVLESPRYVDAPLSSKGRADSLRAARSTRDFAAHLGTPAVVLTSPLRRAKQTAELVFDREIWGASVEIHENELVRERLTGRPCDLLEDEFAAVRQNPITELEDNSKLQLRCAAFLQRIAAQKDGADYVAVVSHKAFLRELDNYLRAHWTVGAGLKEQKIYSNAEARLYTFDFGRKEVGVKFCRA